MPIPAAGAEPQAWFALHLIHGLGGEGMRKLLTRFGAPSAVLLQSVSALSLTVTPAVARAIVQGPTDEAMQASLSWLEHESNHLLTLADDDYPAQLLEIADPPPILYLKGNRALLGRPGLAVVGSRNATPSGLQNAEAFARNLSEAGFTIISGMALGIDAAAHRGGLAGKGSSIAVVGTGLDLVYPARNKVLAHDLAQKGLIVSEFPLGTPALAKNFPRRNRIISGLSRGVLVVEAALASGSLITARQAGEQGREVFAIPGSIHSPFSKGCHQLIKQGAKLVEEAHDILIELHWADAKPVVEKGPPDVDNPEDDPLLTVMGFDPVAIDTLLDRAKVPTEQLIARLTELELDGVIASMPGGKYQRLR